MSLRATARQTHLRRVGTRLATMMIAAAWLAAGAVPVLAADAKRDFRGLVPGMTVAQAKAAAAKAGMACETSFTGQTTCRGGDATVALTTTGREANLVWELRVTLAGHFEAAAMKADLVAFYGLTATAVPDVYATAAGQELMLLEIGRTSTAFYLRDPKVLYGGPEALPPPKL